MPNFNIVKSSEINKTYRVSAVIGSFDIQVDKTTEVFKGSIDLPDNWNIGVIVGASGTGKTTIAKELFPDAYFSGFEYGNNTILDDMPEGKTVKQITEMFCSCGFASTMSWLKPYHVLSNGEKMRVDIANALLRNQELTVFDEFTSVIDRQVAQIGSYAVQKAIRKQNKKFIAVTCHYDVLDWLCPDWMLDTNTMQFKLCSKKKDQTLSLKSAKAVPNIGSILSVTTI